MSNMCQSGKVVNCSRCVFLKVLTKDSVTVSVDAVVYYRLFDTIGTQWLLLRTVAPIVYQHLTPQPKQSTKIPVKNDHSDNFSQGIKRNSKRSQCGKRTSFNKVSAIISNSSSN